MDGRIWSALHLYQGRLCRFESGFQLKGVLHVNRGFLVVSVSFQYFPQSEVLLPGALIGRLHFQRPPSQENGVVQVLQSEQDASQIK